MNEKVSFQSISMSENCLIDNKKDFSGLLWSIHDSHTDVEIRSPSGDIAWAHRALLASFSSFFQNILSDPAVNSHGKIVILLDEDIHFPSILCILRLLYSGKIKEPVSHSGFESLVDTIQLLQLKMVGLEKIPARFPIIPETPLPSPIKPQPYLTPNSLSPVTTTKIQLPERYQCPLCPNKVVHCHICSVTTKSPLWHFGVKHHYIKDYLEPSLYRKFFSSHRYFNKADWTNSDLAPIRLPPPMPRYHLAHIGRASSSSSSIPSSSNPSVPQIPLPLDKEPSYYDKLHFKCPLCSETYRGLFNVRRHLLSHRRDEVAGKIASLSPEANNSSRCFICSQNYRFHRCSLRSLLKTLMNEESILSDTHDPLSLDTSPYVDPQDMFLVSFYFHSFRTMPRSLMTQALSSNLSTKGIMLSLKISDLDNLQKCLDLVVDIRSKSTELWKVTSEGAEGAENAFLSTLKLKLEDIGVQIKELERSLSNQQPIINPLLLGPSVYLSLDPAAETVPIYSNLVAGYNRSYGKVTKSRRRLQNQSHAVPPHALDNLISMINRMYGDMSFNVYRPNGSKLNAIVEVSLERILKSVVVFKGLMIEWVVVKSHTEEISRKDVWSSSRYQVFRKITENASAAMLHFQSPVFPEMSVKSFMTYLHSYVTLFTENCRKCGLHLQNNCPPTWREFKTLESFHEDCRPS
ncbi:MED27 [Lepeophtheirus salmonis]|uniref:MED27 n=1 Tax=Lepeophtheirus salmonis TaxID=72036 RepID=A0A7R8CG66_LEPSM|nr:MED27 [Lepeophtheirus salmonis]CAF2813003.1 MED27 [Lepeophtheirus salmonis]